MSYVSEGIDINKNLVVYKDGNVVLTLPHISTVAYVHDHYTSRTFDQTEDLLEFIDDMKRRYSTSEYLFFIPLGYDIVDEHYIEFFYRIYSSNS